MVIDLYLGLSLYFSVLECRHVRGGSFQTSASKASQSSLPLVEDLIDNRCLTFQLYRLYATPPQKASTNRFSSHHHSLSPFAFQTLSVQTSLFSTLLNHLTRSVIKSLVATIGRRRRDRHKPRPRVPHWHRRKMGQDESTMLDHSVPPHSLTARTLEAVAEYIKGGRTKRIVVLTGAGISTAAGSMSQIFTQLSSFY